jgi:hypothetical protein
MFEILDLLKPSRWEEYLKLLQASEQDIYFTPQYYSIYQQRSEGKALCTIYQKGDDIALYPFILNDINSLGYDLNEQYFDIQGGYGYNGVLSNSNSSSFLKSFYDIFNDFCLDNNIVSEFLRFNPLLNNHMLHRPDFNVIYDRNNINVNLLNDNMEKTEYEYSTRKNIKKAIASGLSFRFFYGNEISIDDIETFYQVYSLTMDRNNAESFYYFDIDYFVNISRSLPRNSLFVFVLVDYKIISCELVLLGSSIAYSFLGGTLSEYFQFRPNDFLKHKTIELLKSLGFQNYLLGGGDEGVFRYKKSFSKNGIVPFFIGKKIHNPLVYKRVVEQWEKLFPSKVEKYKNYLLKYRYTE